MPDATSSTAGTDPVLAEIRRLYDQRRGGPTGRPVSCHHHGPRLRTCPRAYRIGELLLQQRVKIGPGRGRGNGYGCFSAWCAALPFTHAMIWQYIRAYTDWSGPPPAPVHHVEQQPVVPQLQPRPVPPPPPRVVWIDPPVPKQEQQQREAEERAAEKAVKIKLREKRRREQAEREAERERERQDRQRDALETLDQTRQRIARFLDHHGPSSGGDVADALEISRDRFWAAVHDAQRRVTGFELVFTTPGGWSITEAGRERYLAGDGAA